MIAVASVLLLISYVGFGLFLVGVLLRAAAFRFIAFGFAWWFFVAPWLRGILCGVLALAVLHAAANFLLSCDDRRQAARGISRMHRQAMRILPLLPILGLGGNELIHLDSFRQLVGLAAGFPKHKQLADRGIGVMSANYILSPERVSAAIVATPAGGARNDRSYGIGGLPRAVDRMCSWGLERYSPRGYLFLSADGVAVGVGGVV